jgi:hypothetical protein
MIYRVVLSRNKMHDVNSSFVSSIEVFDRTLSFDGLRQGRTALPLAAASSRENAVRGHQLFK